MRSEFYRRYRVMRMFACDMTTYDTLPARFCDWALAFDQVEKQVESEKMNEDGSG